MVGSRYEYVSNDDVTPEFEAAVAALRKLPAEMKTKAFAEAASEGIRESAAQRLGSRSTGRSSWRRLLGQRRVHDDELPADDHYTLWTKDGVLTYVSQLYGLSMDDIRAMVTACDEHGLTVQVGAGSWHNPMSTLLVMWRKAG